MQIMASVPVEIAIALQCLNKPKEGGMDILEFIASLTGSLAWPLALIAIFLALRKPLRDLLPFLQELKIREFEIEFGRRVDEVTAEVARELPADEKQTFATPLPDQIFRLAQISPRAAVLEAWRAVEASALEAARRLGAELSAGQSYQAIRFLERNEKADRDLVSLLRDLKGLRNEAAHVPEFSLSTSAALEYATSANMLSAYLRRLKDSV